MVLEPANESTVARRLRRSSLSASAPVPVRRRRPVRSPYSV